MNRESNETLGVDFFLDIHTTDERYFVKAIIPKPAEEWRKVYLQLDARLARLQLRHLVHRVGLPARVASPAPASASAFPAGSTSTVLLPLTQRRRRDLRVPGIGGTNRLRFVSEHLLRESSLVTGATTHADRLLRTRLASEVYRLGRVAAGARHPRKR